MSRLVGACTQGRERRRGPGSKGNGKRRTLFPDFLLSCSRVRLNSGAACVLQSYFVVFRRYLRCLDEKTYRGSPSQRRYTATDADAAGCSGPGVGGGPTVRFPSEPKSEKSDRKEENEPRFDTLAHPLDAQERHDVGMPKLPHDSNLILRQLPPSSQAQEHASVRAHKTSKKRE